MGVVVGKGVGADSDGCCVGVAVGREVGGAVGIRADVGGDGFFGDYPLHDCGGKGGGEG